MISIILLKFFNPFIYYLVYAKLTTKRPFVGEVGNIDKANKLLAVMLSGQNCRLLTNVLSCIKK